MSSSNSEAIPPIMLGRKQPLIDVLENREPTRHLPPALADSPRKHPIPLPKFNLKFSGHGWQFVVRLAAGGAAFVLFVNIATTIYVATRPKLHRGIAVIYSGDCSRNETIGTCIHLLINTASTLLLSGSNYTMQVLSAPTRRETDKAHCTGRWLDIGVQSVRNLRYISYRRMLLWLLLAFSSVPLHLVYVL